VAVIYYQALLGVGQPLADCASLILLQQEPIVLIRRDAEFSSSSTTTHFLNLAKSAVRGKTIGVALLLIELLYTLRLPTFRAPLGSRFEIRLLVEINIVLRFEACSVVRFMLAPVSALAFRTPWL
jgi:hypothetical protein